MVCLSEMIQRVWSHGMRCVLHGIVLGYNVYVKVCADEKALEICATALLSLITSYLPCRAFHLSSQVISRHNWYSLQPPLSSNPYSLKALTISELWLQGCNMHPQ